MNVYLFRLNKSVGYGSGQVIVAANDPTEAWLEVEKELPEYDKEYFTEKRCEQIHSLTSICSEPCVITYNCYVE